MHQPVAPVVAGQNIGGGMEKYISDIVYFSSVAVIAFIIGRDAGYRDGAINAYYATMAEVHRQCESKFPLLVVDEFFYCRKTGKYLND